MYEAHWQLNQRPFEPKLSGDFYYPSELHQAALLKLRYAIENRRSISVIGADSGMGKSLVLQQLRSQLPDFAVPIISVVYPALSADDFVRYLAKQLTPEIAQASFTVADAIGLVEQTLRKNAESGQHAILIIEEAEWLESQGLLDVLRLLLNFGLQEAAAESALTIVLSGQPVLLGQLERYPALDQRVAVRCLLKNFSIDETVAYIGHRIRQAGGNVDAIFHPDALEAIHHFAEGIPRRINALSDLALMVGYAQEHTKLRASLIESVQRELVPSA